jgi:hypothetical protein
LFYTKTSSYYNIVLVEKHQVGFGHRITVYNDIVVSTTKKLPWGITGDGESTIKHLLQFTDDEILSMLKDQNLGLESILEKERFVPLRRK